MKGKGIKKDIEKEYGSIIKTYGERKDNNSRIVR